jgi:hypothetical protein
MICPTAQSKYFYEGGWTTQITLIALANFLSKRDSLRRRYRALVYGLSMISAQTRSAFVARENRCPLFRIML